MDSGNANGSINMSSENLYNVSKKVSSIALEYFPEVKLSVNRVDLSGVELSNAYLLDEAKKNVEELSLLLKEMNERIKTVISIYCKNDANMDLLFRILDGDDSENFAIDFFSYDKSNLDNRVDFRYVVDCQSLIDRQEAGRLTIRKHLASLYGDNNEDGVKYLDEVIKNVRENYQGREKWVNTALTILWLAAEKNSKIAYEHHGTGILNGVKQPVLTEYVVNGGVDCNAYVSWILWQDSKTRTWEAPKDFIVEENIIPTSNYENVLPGDLFVNYGHIGMILQNDIENHEFIVTDARGPGFGVVIRRISYDDDRIIDDTRFKLSDNKAYVIVDSTPYIED